MQTVLELARVYSQVFHIQVELELELDELGIYQFFVVAMDSKLKDMHLAKKHIIKKEKDISNLNIYNVINEIKELGPNQILFLKMFYTFC